MALVGMCVKMPHENMLKSYVDIVHIHASTIDICIRIHIEYLCLLLINAFNAFKLKRKMRDKKIKCDYDYKFFCFFFLLSEKVNKQKINSSKFNHIFVKYLDQ